ncbi:hypothetical protein BX666DRAFT_1901681 [Dichotomocladium elegans]|nr:hypothetical protein BX666DRAFT_1901681 [Dichotomocladium elegans]
MSVQATIALLNRNASTTGGSTVYSKTPTTNVTPCISKSALVSSTWNEVGSKQRRSSSDKSSRVAELERIRSSSNGGVASILNKFNCSEAVAIPRKTAGRPSSSIAPSGFQAIKHPVCSDRIDSVLDDLTEMYERAVEQARRARDDFHSLSVKSREYEEQIRYLTKQVGEMSHERDELKMQLSMALNHDNKEDRCCCKQQEAINQISLLGTQEAEESNNETCNENSSSMDPVDCTGITCTSNVTTTNDALSSSNEELLFVKKQLTALERGTQTIFEKQAKDLETQRKQTRTLTEVVHAQEKLIMALEIKLASSRFDKDCILLLQDQVELQQIEIDDKCKLLSRLFEERGGDSIHHHRPGYSHGGSSSLPLNSECGNLSRHSTSSRASTPSLQPSSARSSYTSTGLLSLGRSTTPFMSPPRDPLPPLPHTLPTGSVAGKNVYRGSYISSSLSSNSLLSQSTSWSSAEYAMMRPIDKAYVPTTLADGELQSWADYTPLHIVPAPSKAVSRQPSSRFTLKRHSNNHNSTAFWKSWKQRLSARQ